MAFKIRNGTTLDIMDIKEINEKCLVENYPFDVYLWHLTNWGNICFVATVNDTIVGYIMCFGPGGNCQDTEQIGHITSIAVLPDHRGQGIATRLMTSALVAMKKNKFHLSQLYVRESNAPAIHIYQDRLKYTSIEKIKNYYTSPVEDALSMERKL